MTQVEISEETDKLVFEGRRVLHRHALGGQTAKPVQLTICKGSLMFHATVHDAAGSDDGAICVSACSMMSLSAAVYLIWWAQQKASASIPGSNMHAVICSLMCLDHMETPSRQTYMYINWIQ